MYETQDTRTSPDSLGNGVASFRETSLIGAAAGVIAATVQVVVGWVLSQTLLPAGHDNNISPRFVNRLIHERGKRTNPLVDWLLGTLFHYGYGIGWGLVFGLLKRWTRLPSLPLGGLIGWLIYLLAFSRAGAGTKTHTEQHPRHRPWHKQVSLVSVAFTFALSLAATYDWLARRWREAGQHNRGIGP